jgi:hypothetical protein
MASLCRSFKDGKPSPFSELHHIFFGHLPFWQLIVTVGTTSNILSLVCFFYKIIFVCNYDDLDVGLGMIINFLKPSINIFKRLFIEHVEHKHDSIRTFVVCVGDGAVPLLASCIPNLKLKFLTTMSEWSESEINPDSRHVVLVELIVGKPDEQAALPDTGVSQQDHLEEVVVIFPDSSRRHFKFIFKFLINI